MEDRKKLKRVVITGIGLASPIGINYDDFSKNLLLGRSGFVESSPNERVAGASNYVSKIKESDLRKIIDELEIQHSEVIHNVSMSESAKYIKKAELLLLWSCLSAFVNSKLTNDKFKSYEGGLFIGVDAQNDDFFHYCNFLKNIEVNPDIDFETFISLVRQKIEKYYPSSGIIHLMENILAKSPFTGDIEFLMDGCSSSNDCIGTGFRKIRAGKLKFALCGTVDIPVDPLYYAMFSSMNLISNSSIKDECLVPYSAEHVGFTLSEGAGAILLEEYESAIARGAHIYGELVGYSANMATHHLTNCDPDGESASLCIKAAIEDANLSTDSIDYINSHGMSTILDVSETKALKRVFGQRIYNVPISSTKSILGHSLVASGLLECIATICCLENNKVHPTLGLKKCKNECDLFYTPQKAIDKDIRAAISTSYAFLGYNSCIVLRKNEKNG